jgi:hypothetical protein
VSLTSLTEIEPGSLSAVFSEPVTTVADTLSSTITIPPYGVTFNDGVTSRTHAVSPTTSASVSGQAWDCSGGVDVGILTVALSADSGVVL